jgi:pimeloyl-ACP methyl ester carboxylesterase
LSGWGQKFDALESIFEDLFPESVSVTSFDYLVFDNIEELFHKIKTQKLNPTIVVGWSLGGQLLIRLAEKKVLTPKLLILLAAPFQMVKDKRIETALSKTAFDIFYKNFCTAPGKTLKKFLILAAINDLNSKNIVKNLNIDGQNFLQLKFWLEELNRFSCFETDFSDMPRTLFFQGAADKIVDVSQTHYFRQRIKNLRLEILANCGHAPHLNDSKKLRKIIIEEIINIT